MSSAGIAPMALAEAVSSEATIVEGIEMNLSCDITFGLAYDDGGGGVWPYEGWELNLRGWRASIGPVNLVLECSKHAYSRDNMGVG